MSQSNSIFCFFPGSMDYERVEIFHLSAIRVGGWHHADLRFIIRFKIIRCKILKACLIIFEF